MTIRSKTFGHCVLERIHIISEKLSHEYDPKKIHVLKETLDKLFVVWEKRAERRKVTRS